MKQKKDLSVEKQIERLQKQIIKFGDSTGQKGRIIAELKEGLNNVS